MTTPHSTTDPTAPASFWGRDGRGDGFRAATVCRQGHQQATAYEAYPGKNLGSCSECGDLVLGECPECGLRIKGRSWAITPRPGQRPTYDEHPNKFCDRCSVPYPWASDEQRVRWLLSLLNDLDISDEDRAVVSEHLKQLQTLAAKDNVRRESKLLTEIKKRAPGLFVAGAGKILERLVSDEAWRMVAGG
ncbi:DUF2321 domain-containing protein [Micromonospora coerulea]|uniref:DUF2321 domain-containing protein n=1 Tax=Micromonospora coerulea TaxID=47856 RepID=UPI0019038AC2|nr:DUF2321 domain-containing protein [Micromonospora veneta]